MRDEDKVEKVQSILGFGLDDGEGHVRMTEGDAFSLLMGSEKTHQEMLSVIQELERRAAERGKSLSDLTRSDILEIAKEMEKTHQHRFPDNT